MDMSTPAVAGALVLLSSVSESMSKRIALMAPNRKSWKE
jgi:hypothetical protein